MTFLNPLDALIPKIPFSVFAVFWVWVTSEARGSVSVGFWGSHQLSPFWGGGWGGSIDPPLPPLQLKPACPCPRPLLVARPTGAMLLHQVARLTVHLSAVSHGACSCNAWHFLTAFPDLLHTDAQFASSQH